MIRRLDKKVLKASDKCNNALPKVVWYLLEEKLLRFRSFPESFQKLFCDARKRGIARRSYRSPVATLRARRSFDKSRRSSPVRLSPSKFIWLTRRLSPLTRRPPLSVKDINIIPSICGIIVRRCFLNVSIHLGM